MLIFSIPVTQTHNTKQRQQLLLCQKKLCYSFWKALCIQRQSHNHILVCHLWIHFWLTCAGSIYSCQPNNSMNHQQKQFLMENLCRWSLYNNSSALLVHTGGFINSCQLNNYTKQQQKVCLCYFIYYIHACQQQTGTFRIDLCTYFFVTMHPVWCVHEWFIHILFAPK